MPIVHTPRPAVLSLIAALALAGIARAEVAPPTTQPLRTIAVVGTGVARDQDNDDGRKRAVASACDAALVNAKQNAERGTKVLGVHLGAPITVDAPSIVDDTPTFSGGKPSDRYSLIKTSVRIVFELVP